MENSRNKMLISVEVSAFLSSSMESCLAHSTCGLAIHLSSASRHSLVTEPSLLPHGLSQHGSVCEDATHLPAASSKWKGEVTLESMEFDTLYGFRHPWRVL